VLEIESLTAMGNKSYRPLLADSCLSTHASASNEWYAYLCSPTHPCQATLAKLLSVGYGEAGQPKVMAEEARPEGVMLQERRPDCLRKIYL